MWKLLALAWLGCSLRHEDSEDEPAGAAEAASNFKDVSVSEEAKAIHAKVLEEECVVPHDGRNVVKLRGDDCVVKRFVHYAVAYGYAGAIAMQYLGEPISLLAQKYRDLDRELHKLMVQDAAETLRQRGVVLYQVPGKLWTAERIYLEAIKELLRRGAFRKGTTKSFYLVWLFLARKVYDCHVFVAGGMDALTLSLKRAMPEMPWTERRGIHAARLKMLKELGTLQRAYVDPWLVAVLLDRLAFDAGASEVSKAEAAQMLGCFVNDEPRRTAKGCKPVGLGHPVVDDAIMVVLELNNKRDSRNARAYLQAELSEAGGL